MKKFLVFSPLLVFALVTVVYAGSLSPLLSPAATSYTLSDIYTRLTTNATATEANHAFSPAGSPASTLSTLTQIYEAIPTIVAAKVFTGSTYLGVTGTLTGACVTATFNGTSNKIANANDGGGNGNNRWCMTDTGDAAVGDILTAKKAWVDGVEVTGTNAGGITYGLGLPKTGQQPNRPTGTPFNAGDDTAYADPAGGAGKDIGYPRGLGTWAAYNANGGRFTLGTGADAGTITDNATGLIWELKTDVGGIHDYNNTYTWGNAFDVFIAAVNAEGGTGFAGHNDWRLPNVKELMSIVDYGVANPCVDQAFNTAPYFTIESSYWSSTTLGDAGADDLAWMVYFRDGDIWYDDKTSAVYVRAVRGGY
jgi:hypothetical protein